MQPPATPPWPQAPRGSSRALPGAHKRAPGHSPGFSHIQAPARGWAGGEALSPLPWGSPSSLQPEPWGVSSSCPPKAPVPHLAGAGTAFPSPGL